METLAIVGENKAVTHKLAGWPRFDAGATSAVQAVLRSGKVNTELPEVLQSLRNSPWRKEVVF
jgi:hypothetical protein